MQPVRRPIGRHVRSVAPDGANLLAADRLPNALSVLNGSSVEQNRRASDGNLRRDRRRAVEDLDSHSAQHGERDGHYHSQRNPQFSVIHTGYLSGGAASLEYPHRRSLSVRPLHLDRPWEENVVLQMDVLVQVGLECRQRLV